MKYSIVTEFTSFIAVETRDKVRDERVNTLPVTFPFAIGFVFETFR